MEPSARVPAVLRTALRLGLTLLLLAGPAASAATLTLTEAESGRTFGLAPEDLVVIRLSECAGCGSALELVSAPDPGVLRLLSHTVEGPGGIGGSSTHTWQYATVGTGPASVSFRYGRPWDPGSAVTYVFTFEAGSALRVVSFEAVPAQVAPGGPASLRWATTGAASVLLTWPGDGPCCALSVGANGATEVTPRQTTTYTLEARSAAGTAAQARATVAVLDCPAPAAPRATGPAGPLPRGSAFALAWTEGPESASAAAAYEARLALDPSFSAIAQGRSTPAPSATFTVPAEAADAVHARVRAIAGCGAAGPWSNVVSVGVARPPATVLLVEGQSPRWDVRVGEPPPAATLRFRNAGSAPATVAFAPSGGFFTVSPASLVLAPGQETAVSLRAADGATAAAGTRQGSVTASWPEGSATAAVTLTAAESLGGAVPLVDRDRVFSLASGGGVHTLAVTVTNPGPVPMRLAPSLPLGGGWLSLVPEDLSGVVPPGESRSLRLAVDRSRRTAADGPPPVSAQVDLRAAGAGEGRLLRVFDAEPPAVESVAARAPADADHPSFVVPTAVHASGAMGALFTSDGWIRNLSAAPVVVDLLATPAAGGPALKVEQTLPPLALVRLYDLVLGLFGRTDLAASVEIRPRRLADAAQLAVRAVAEGQPGGGERNQRYASEIPVASSGSGTGVGRAPLLMPALDVTSDVRTNILLSETSGSDAAVRLTLLSPDGTALAATASPVHVPAWGLAQAPLAAWLGLAPGAVVRGASLLVEGAAGAGRVVALGTAIDNVSQSFRALPAAPVASTAAGTATAVVIPSIVHSRGLGNTLFTTRLSVTNLASTPAALRLVYSYSGTDGAGAPVSGARPADVTVGPRGALPVSLGDDAVVRLFALPTGWSTSGSLRVEGAGVLQCLVASWVQTVDAATPDRNVKYASVPGFTADSRAVVGPGAEPALLSSGLAKVAGWRTNLILTEVAGQPARVRVRLVDGVTGLPLGETEVLPLAPFEKRQVNDESLWPLLGLPAGARDRLQMVLETVGSDPGRVAGVLTEIAGDGSNATLVTPFGPAGPPGPEPYF